MLVSDITVGGKRRWRAHGDNVLDVIQWLDSTRATWPVNTNRSSDRWDLNAGLAGTRRLALEGWSAGALDLADKLGGRVPPNTRKSKWRHDMGGELPDMPRHLAGAPDSMMRRGEDKGHKPIVSICVNVWIRCDVKAAHMANYGAAMVAMIDHLENCGKRVEVRAVVAAPHCLDDTSTFMSASWMVKNAEDGVDLGALAFSLAHPGASRWFGWEVWRRSTLKYDKGYGRGNGYEMVEDDLIDPVPGVIMLPGLNSNPSACRTIEEALVFVRNEINGAAGEELITLEEAYA